jgi:hypothetical protein
LILGELGPGLFAVDATHPRDDQVGPPIPLSLRNDLRDWYAQPIVKPQKRRALMLQHQGKILCTSRASSATTRFDPFENT